MVVHACIDAVTLLIPTECVRPRRPSLLLVGNVTIDKFDSKGESRRAQVSFGSRHPPPHVEPGLALSARQPLRRVWAAMPDVCAESDLRKNNTLLSD